MDGKQKKLELSENEPSSIRINGHAFSSSLSGQNLNSKPGIISKDNFYGSPSKMASNNASSATASTNLISSFSDRLKKMNSQNCQAVETSQKAFLSDKQSNTDISTNNPNSYGNWFSPMKKLRLEDSSLEKLSFNGEDTLNSKNYLFQNIDSVVSSNDLKEPLKTTEQDKHHDPLLTGSFIMPVNNYSYSNLTSFPSFSNNINNDIQASSLFDPNAINGYTNYNNHDISEFQ